jgi:iron complex outermembrane receptor protein
MRYQTGTPAFVLIGILMNTASALAQDTPDATPVASKGGAKEIVITASPITGARDRFATIVEKVERNAILNKGGSTIAEALATVPGVSGTSFASGASRPVIRGFDASRVRMLENGLGSFDVSEVGPDHGVPIDPLSAQSIEVVRGAATLRYGSQAIGGVVNAINNRVPTKLPDRPFAAEVAGSFGTVADLRQGSAMVDARLGSLAFHADGFARQTDDYDTPLGKMANSFFEGSGYSAGGSLFFGNDNKSRFGGAGIHYHAKYGIPGEDTFIEMQQSKGLVRSSFDLGAGALKTLTVDGGFANYKHQEIDPAIGALSTFKDIEWDSRAELVMGEIGWLSASAFGVQLQNRDFSGLGEAADYLLPTSTKTQAVFGFTEAPLGAAANLQAGVRTEEVRTRGTPHSLVPTMRTFQPLSGSLGVLFDLSDRLKLGVNAASAARAPGITELFASGPHDGPQTFETGDPALKLERANSIEGSARIKVRGGDIEASLWGTKFKNYIYGQLTGNLCDETGDCTSPAGAELKELFVRQQDADFWGAEGKATFNLWSEGDQAITTLFLGDIVRAEFGDGTNVPRIPPFRVGAGLTWACDEADIGVLYLYSGAQKHVGAIADSPTKSFSELQAQAAWRPFASNRNIEIALVGHNLLDEEQRNAAAINKDDVILPGRDARLVLRAAF